MGSGEVLLSRFVQFEDEIAELIKEQGLPPLHSTLAVALEGIPTCDRQAVTQREVMRYRQEVEKPAEDALRERKLRCPSSVKRVPVAFTGGDDPVSYSQALEGIEPRLVVIEQAPVVRSLVLRVSWPLYSPFHSFPRGAFISSAHGNMLALYVGPYRPCLSLRGFYLAYDVCTNSISVIPQLPSRSVSMLSHTGIGTGVAILSISGMRDFFLVELLLRKVRGLPSCQGTLFKWRSSGPAANQWIQNEVDLPLPTEPQEHTSVVSSTFRADIVSVFGSSGIFWADLLHGILICTDLSVANPSFRFVSWPISVIKPGVEGREAAAVHRSVCFMNETFNFITINSNAHGDPYDPTITVWVLEVKDNKIPIKLPTWLKVFSFNFQSTVVGPLCKGMRPMFPVLSMAYGSTPIIYVTVVPDLGSVPGRLKERVWHVVCIDLNSRRVLNVFRGDGLAPANLLATVFSSYQHKVTHMSLRGVITNILKHKYAIILCSRMLFGCWVIYDVVMFLSVYLNIFGTYNTCKLTS